MRREGLLHLEYYVCQPTNWKTNTMPIKEQTLLHVKATKWKQLASAKKLISMMYRNFSRFIGRVHLTNNQ